MGGANSLLFSATYPEKVKALTMVDWAPTIDSASLQILAGMAGQSWKTFEDALEYMKLHNPSRTEDNLRQRLKYALCQRDGAWTWKSDIAGLLSRAERMKEAQSEYVDFMWKQVPLVECPLLLLKGEKSNFVTMENAQKLIDGKNRKLEVIAKAGHSIQGDNPEDFYSAVMGFISWTESLQK